MSDDAYGLLAGVAGLGGLMALPLIVVNRLRPAGLLALVALAACVVLFAGVASGAFPPGRALAQSAAELVRDGEKKAKDVEGAVRAWVRQNEGREDAYRQEAESFVRQNEGRMREGFTYLGGTDLAEDGLAMAAAAQPQSGEGVVYVAVSLSMPPDRLRVLGREAHRAGAVMVIRGLVDNSFKATFDKARHVFDENTAAGLAIDPQVFRAFDVERVPTVIAAKGPVEPCEEGLDCTSPATPADKVAGNISLAAALEILATEGEQAPDVARSALVRLGG